MLMKNHVFVTRSLAWCYQLRFFKEKYGLCPHGLKQWYGRSDKCNENVCIYYEFYGGQSNLLALTLAYLARSKVESCKEAYYFNLCVINCN